MLLIIISIALLQWGYSWLSKFLSTAAKMHPCIKAIIGHFESHEYTQSWNKELKLSQCTPLSNRTGGCQISKHLDESPYRDKSKTMRGVVLMIVDSMTLLPQQTGCRHYACLGQSKCNAYTPGARELEELYGTFKIYVVLYSRQMDRHTDRQTETIILIPTFKIYVFLYSRQTYRQTDR